MLLTVFNSMSYVPKQLHVNCVWLNDSQLYRHIKC
jgi:hypothetical protein